MRVISRLSMIRPDPLGSLSTIFRLSLQGPYLWFRVRTYNVTSMTPGSYSYSWPSSSNCPSSGNPALILSFDRLYYCRSERQTYFPSLTCKSFWATVRSCSNYYFSPISHRQISYISKCRPHSARTWPLPSISRTHWICNSKPWVWSLAPTSHRLRSSWRSSRYPSAHRQRLCRCTLTKSCQ